MRIGTICLSTLSGTIPRDFHRNGIITDVLVVSKPGDFSKSWYPGSSLATANNIQKMLDEVDAVLLFEGVMNHDLVVGAHDRNLPIAYMPIYGWSNPNLLIHADLFLCPSPVEYAQYSSTTTRTVQVTVPVSQMWRLRNNARSFVHNAGSQTRSGTPEILQSMQFVKSPIALTIFGRPTVQTGKYDDNKPILSQSIIAKLAESFTTDNRVTFVLNEPEPENFSLYDRGDVFLQLPKFGGLSLPLQEAFSSGMLVLTTDRKPFTDWLPNRPMVSTNGSTHGQGAVALTQDVLDPAGIATAIDAWYERDIDAFSLAGQQWAEENSWTVWKPRYIEILDDLIRRHRRR
ncbi:hypothetical protein M0R72_07395 [Candidatus Pacearchaeota archaeon]|jgi:hypothetical protein|nr:hypothetical protein [Candidatus Pacearchaeota archaeon]